MDFCCGKIDLRPCDVCDFSVGKLQGGSLKWFRNEISWKSWHHMKICAEKILLRPPKERCICHGHFSFHEEARARASIFRFAPWWVSYLGLMKNARRIRSSRACSQKMHWKESRPVEPFTSWSCRDPIARVNPRFITLKTNMGTQKLVGFGSMFLPLLLNWYFQVNQPAGRVFGVLQLEDSMICFMEFPCLILGWTCVAVFQQRMLQPFTKSKYVEMQEKPFAKSAKKYQVWRLGSTQWI